MPCNLLQGWAMKFTDKYVLNLKAKEKMYQVREGDGFGIRVLPSGFKIWIFIYTFSGKRRQMNLGDYPDISLSKARSRSGDARQALKDGKDPQEVGFEWHKNPERERREAAQKAEEDRKNPTIRQLALEYMEKHAKVQKRESSWTEDARLLNKNVLPAWGDRKAYEIRKRDCTLLLESFQDRPALCNNILKLTRKMFNFAVERDILEFSPFTGVKAPVKITHRERTLSEAEIKTLWNTELPKACMSDEVKRILKLILVTGQRPGEVAGINAREVDGNWWTIPSERAKNKNTHRVFLTETALELLGEPSLGGFYFPSPIIKTDINDNPVYQHIDENAVAYAIRRNLKDYQPRRPIKGNTVRMVKVTEDKKMDMAHFTPQDLRRTCATFLAKIGSSDEVIDAVLGHKKQGVVKIYNQHKYDMEKQKAMETWERKLNSLVAGKENENVIPMTRNWTK
ncbi:MAG: site-specific integrase [Desulfuromonadales bacterium]|nr:MAG: site-specific integrase [Desulfuromonadales bacterium]